MFKFHRFEYKRTSKPLVIYFISDIVSYGMMIYMLTIQRLDRPVSHFLIVVYMLNFPQIMLGFGILYLKDNKDVLQELSKLDYLVHVSIF